MNNELNNWLRSFTSFKRSEKRGIIVLLIIILIISTINILLPEFAKPEISEKYNHNIEAVKKFMKEQKRLSDSIAKVKDQKKLSTGNIGDSLFYFDPNTISDSIWQVLGLSTRQIVNINNFKKKGGLFKQKHDLKKMYTISENEYKILEPYIKIKNKKAIKQKKNYKAIDINTADSASLVENLYLDPKIAQRTIKYRKLLGGFHSVHQIKEVYGLKQKTYETISSYISIDTGSLIKLDVNNSTFKEIVGHPYFDYETTKKIMEYRKNNDGFRSLNELLEAGISSDSSFQKQKYYLYIRPL